MARKPKNYDRDNAMAAARILADPARYEGLPVLWARAWQSRQGAERKLPVSAAMTATTPGRMAGKGEK